MSFPRYPKYKDSGVEWLGEVPEHWDVDAAQAYRAMHSGRMRHQRMTSDRCTASSAMRRTSADGRWTGATRANVDLQRADDRSSTLRAGDLVDQQCASYRQAALACARSTACCQLGVHGIRAVTQIMRPEFF